VDVDELPCHRWPLTLLTRIDPAAHLAGGRCQDRHGTGIRGDVIRLLSRHGIELPGDTRVLLLAHAKVLGHVFDPLSVFWCLAPDNALRACVLEVHNTYGQRHAYVVAVDENGGATVDKAFPVSPFTDATGTYTARLRLDEDRLSVSVRLDRAGARVLTAAMSGRPRMATRSAILAVAARHLLMTQRVTAFIRWHGVRLWLKHRRIARASHNLESPSR
jgi:DUF1365 family protein